MAKTKKEKAPIIEETKTVVPEQPFSSMPSIEIAETPSVEDIKPETLTADGITAIPEIYQVKEEEKIPETAYKSVSVITSENLSMEEKINKFLDSRDAGEVRMNDFLKSLFPIPKFNEPPLWLKQENCKMLRIVLERMYSKGEINIISESHRRLGMNYYPDLATGRREHYTLNSLQIIAKK